MWLTVETHCGNTNTTTIAPIPMKQGSRTGDGANLPAHMIKRKHLKGLSTNEGPSLRSWWKDIGQVIRPVIHVFLKWDQNVQSACCPNCQLSSNLRGSPN
ncbi:unnamed protein product [Lota lota]